MTAVNETTNIVIPDVDDVQVTGGGGKTYRFAKGKIVTGRADDGSLKEPDKGAIVGRVTRIGIYKGRTKDQYQKEYEQFECDIMTARGEVYLKAGLLDENGNFRVSQAALTFAWGLTLPFVQNGGIAHISASQGEPWTDERGNKREASTYVNWAEVKDGKGIPHYRPKTDRNAPKVSSEDKFRAIIAELQKSPLWGDRPISREDDEDGSPNTHLSALCQLAAQHGWPTPEQAPQDWLGFYALWRNTPGDVKASLSQVSDDDWGEFRQMLIHRGEVGFPNDNPPRPATWTVPKPLRAAADRLAGPASTNNAALD